MLTTIPSLTIVPQAGTNFLPALTIHTRQDAHSLVKPISSIFIWHKLGILTPTCFAASSIFVPLGTDTALPFIVKLTKLISKSLLNNN